MSIKNVATSITVALFLLGSTQLLADDMVKDDMTITNDVKDKITSTTNIPTVGAPNIVVDTKDGKVFLYGVVDASTKPKDVEKMVKEVTGVKDVKSDLFVKGQ